MEIKLIGIFAASLLASVVASISIIPAMIFGFGLFFWYGIQQGKTNRDMLKASVKGALTAKGVLLTFIWIGVVTGIWRASGTLACIVYYSTALCTPEVILLASFLLCCMISFLTGTSFGSAATMGVICGTIAMGMGVDPLWTGGAILSGVYFGDRCSPMSTSALLVSELTITDIYKNIKGMMKRGLVPFLAAALFYGVAGLFMDTAEGTADVNGILSQSFDISLVTVIPAVLVLVLSFMKVPVRRTLATSSAVGAMLCLWLQHMDLMDVLQVIFLGFHPGDGELAKIMYGGGIISMVNVFIIVMLSSCYTGMFGETGFLHGIKDHVRSMAEKITPYGAVVATSLAVACVSCNQTMTIIMGKELCQDLVADKERFALQLEDTAVMIPAAIPWGIAGGVPLAAVGAPITGILTAVYIFFVPLWGFALEGFGRKSVK